MSRRVVRTLLEQLADAQTELASVTADRDRLIADVFREEDTDGCSC